MLELVNDLVSRGRQDAADGKRAGNLRKLAGAARESRYVRRRLVSISRGRSLRRAVQNGRTITRTTMIAAATPGISFIIRTALFDKGRSPLASLLP